jgi:hypothetical protein
MPYDAKVGARILWMCDDPPGSLCGEGTPPHGGEEFALYGPQGYFGLATISAVRPVPGQVAFRAILGTHAHITFREVAVGVGPIRSDQWKPMSATRFKWVNGGFVVSKLRQWEPIVEIDIDGDGVADIVNGMELCSCSILVEQTRVRYRQGWCVTESLISTETRSFTLPAECGDSRGTTPESRFTN